MSNRTLHETSFADAINTINESNELDEQQRRHWATSLRQIAKALDRPIELIPARYSAVRAAFEQLHHVPLGLSAKTLRNHKSNAKSALLWLANERGVPRYGTRLSPEWERLQKAIDVDLVRWRIYAFARFCSANAIGPKEVKEEIVDHFAVYRETIGKPLDSASRRLLAKAWNSASKAVPGWPQAQMAEPPRKSTITVPWEKFPVGLRADIDQYLESLTRVRRNAKGQRIRPLKPSTRRTRFAELQAAARMAVANGIPIEKLDSIAALLAPDVVGVILDGYWRSNGEQPKDFTINLAARFAAIAMETKCLSEGDCRALGDLRHTLEEHRRLGLTDKNIALIRKVLSPGVWTKVLQLPQAMMAEARRQKSRSPVRAAVTAQLAAAIAILITAPVRLANLTSIKLGLNLIKPDGPGSDYWLDFPAYDVKNRIDLRYPLRGFVTEILDEYIRDFRCILLRGRNDEWLFPGQRSGAKGKISFSGQITKRIQKLLGLRITVHQFRHAAAAIILKHRPGEYELVRLLLGHKNVTTTINSYIGLETTHASEVFSDMITKMICQETVR
jgi:Phage integrase family